MKKGFLNRSGRMNKKGTETTQKTMNPTISDVSVGTLLGKVFGRRRNDGHSAVRQTLNVSVNKVFAEEDLCENRLT